MEKKKKRNPSMDYTPPAIAADTLMHNEEPRGEDGLLLISLNC